MLPDSDARNPSNVIWSTRLASALSGPLFHDLPTPPATARPKLQINPTPDLRDREQRPAGDDQSADEQQSRPEFAENDLVRRQVGREQKFERAAFRFFNDRARDEER